MAPQPLDPMHEGISADEMSDDEWVTWLESRYDSIYALPPQPDTYTTLEGR